MEIKITVNVEGMKPVEVKVDVPTEKEVKVEKTRPEPSIYAVFFDETCLGWSKNPELNKIFLLQQQETANLKLRQNGYLFLNEVYDMLGVPRTAYGQLAGWVYYNNPYLDSDNYVDFGIFDVQNRDFVNGRERSTLLDFNCMGNILSYL